jgi:hypothetical protein
MSRKLTASIVSLSALIAAPAFAAAPVAMIEDTAGATPVEALDYLSEGQVIDLAPGASITLGYFSSCQRETIAGGKVTIGAQQSAVTGGTVKRQKVECDGGRMLLSADQNKSGALSFRSPQVVKHPDAQFVLYNRSPVFEVKGPGDLVIQRLDKNAEDVRLTMTAEQLEKGRLFDLAKAKTELDPGGVYLISGEDKGVVVKVDAASKIGKGPLVSRLIRLY